MKNTKIAYYFLSLLFSFDFCHFLFDNIFTKEYLKLTDLSLYLEDSLQGPPQEIHTDEFELNKDKISKQKKY